MFDQHQYQYQPPQNPQQLLNSFNQPQPAASGSVDFNSNSIRRFPQYSGNPAPQPAVNSAPLISVLSGQNQFHPSQSVSWNPPPTASPPGIQQPSAPVARSVQSGALINTPDANGFAFNKEHSEQPKFQELAKLEHKSEPKSAQIQHLPTPAPIPATTSASKDKKDDVVIYYYYYYDDDKNKTDPSLDAIPSLEGFDSAVIPKPKPGKVIIKNPAESKSIELSPNISNQLFLSNKPPEIVKPKVEAVPAYHHPPPPTERPAPSTESTRSTTYGLQNQSLISNIFRYGSSPAPTAPPSSEPQVEPKFESGKLPSSVSVPVDKVSLPEVQHQPVPVIEDHSTSVAPVHTLSTVRTTLPTTTATTTTTTTTPEPTTTTTTTTTTTAAPATETTESTRRRFGHRRPGGNRFNPLNRSRPTTTSTSTTTTTPAPRTERPTRTFTRPAPNTLARRPNRFRKRPGFGDVTEKPEDSPQPVASVTTATPAVRTETSTQFASRRFGGRGRFGQGRGQPSSIPTQPTSTTIAPEVASSSSIESTTRRNFASRGRPQLRGRLPHLRNRNQPSSTPAPESSVTPDANSSGEETSVPNPVSDSLSESTTEPTAAAAAASSETTAATAASSTASPGRGRQRPLFGNRPRPNLFGRRSNSKK